MGSKKIYFWNARRRLICCAMKLGMAIRLAEALTLLVRLAVSNQRVLGRDLDSDVETKNLSDSLHRDL